MEQDLRTLLTSVRDDAPPPRLSVEDIAAAGRHLARRRRRLVLLSSAGGGAAAVVAAVTAALVMASTPAALTPAVNPSTPANPATSPARTVLADARPFVTTYKGYTAGSYLVSDPDLVTVAYQQSSIDAGIDLSANPFSTPSPLPTTTPASGLSRMPELQRGGILVVYRSGAFQPTAFLKSTERLEMSTGVGLLYRAADLTQPPSTSDRAEIQKMREQVPALAWQYAPDAWAVIYWASRETVPTKEELAAIAEGLTPSATREFPVGFHSSSLPRGFNLLSVSYGTDMVSNQVVSAVRLSPERPALPLTEPIDLQSFPALTLSFGRTDAGPRMVDKLDCASSVECQRVLGDGSTYVKVELNGLKPTPATQVTQITLGIRPQDADNMAAWPPAVKVFP
ncbi:hypothetical protein ABT297_11240 [Dactylosporangium sp. NPDC000555]|uniref:hypothetical protein n=1 Tax=Dactylosporangium sp. NPDC000555 TaxID=3154260 RepID=UPI00331D7B15